MSLRRKFYGAFGLIAVLAIGLAVYGAHALNATGDLVVRLYDEPLVGVSYARAASATPERGARLDGSGSCCWARLSSTNGVMSLRRMQTDIDEDLGIVRERVHDPAIGAALDRAERADRRLGSRAAIRFSRRRRPASPRCRCRDAVERQQRDRGRLAGRLD